MAKQEVVAMLLAGGQGSRLGVLTEKIAKPAVPFGSRYRIIDFPLSNCTNSGIETVGVLTQYQPLELNAYVGNGHPWDLDRSSGGLAILPPYQSVSRKDWYKGTANAIYQNIPFIDRYDPHYVLILSGDHIYKMDYDEMLKHHISSEAEVTIAVIEVPWDEASRFGLMKTDSNGIITEFQEKPANPTTNLASMGIYIFNWPTLRKALIEDEADPKSNNDFGKNIIPMLLHQKAKLQAHEFSGYWKDVGTIFSLWEANMDLLDKPEEIDLSDKNWRIYARNPVQPAHYVAEGAIVENTALTDGDEIFGAVYHSVIGSQVTVEEGAVVRDSVLMPGVVVKKGASLFRCIVGINSVVGENARIGALSADANSRYESKFCSNGIVVIQGGLQLKNEVCIAPNSMIGRSPDGSETDILYPETTQEF